MQNETVFYNAHELKQAIEMDPLIQSKVPVLICNSHITGLAVARGLGRNGVPVIALDREAKGISFASKYVSKRGVCPNPVVSEKAFIQYLLDIGPAFKHKCVLIPSMDEWALAMAKYADELSEYYIWPFSSYATIQQILDKSQLYERARSLEVPIPAFEKITTKNQSTIPDRISYPMVLKPINKRAFYDRFKEGLFIVENKEQYEQKIKEAGELELIAQEQVNVNANGYVTIAVYMDGEQNVRGTFAGRRLEIYPPQSGTTCLVESIEAKDLSKRAVSILQAFSYEGIAECEFLYDENESEYKLLDINTRPWKWIGLPIHCGVNLPYLLYSYATGEGLTSVQNKFDTKWVYLNDYQTLKENKQGLFDGDILTKDEWLEILLNNTDESDLIITAVASMDDLGPSYQLLKNKFAKQSYYCPC
ncbi:hypothetical protein [Alkalihalobacillus sp. AL-G]|uniref:carboxylate--amine ligase n=1 Tax=Alkalihalobacillus sp. AL-G TaxID=2926399 RepID=UPI00272D0D88|nr:hypothetical protein [Alkalihalobacillus sp. AL-G]WLD94873.1 hypothetical protein MOJ78_08325 [Alkalihalobacillus sp. AL-G]